MIFSYCPNNRQLGADLISGMLKTVFIAPHLSYKLENPNSITQPESGKVAINLACDARAAAFGYRSVMLPHKSADDYSCGFWAVEIILQLVLGRVSRVDGV